MKKKQILILGLILSMVLGVKNVFAEDLDNHNVYFVSDNGIKLTEKEYNLFNELYGEEYTVNLTKEQYDRVNGYLDINNKEIEINTAIDKEENPFIKYSGKAPLRSTYVQTTYKRIAISKSCGTYSCNVVMTLQWLLSPAIRSYDVMGIRYNGSVSAESPFTIMETNEMTTYPASYVFKSNGFGNSIKLSQTAQSIYITQAFVASGTGRIYGTYQHATSSVSKGTSQMYNINAAGLGNVFDFYGAANGIYDEMNGVYVDISTN